MGTLRRRIELAGTEVGAEVKTGSCENEGP